MPLGMITLVFPETIELTSMLGRGEAIIRLLKFLQFAKASLPTDFTVKGTITSVSEEQPQKALSRMVSN